ncbi:MAG: hypothetical protein MZU79_03830 [Anaerotruncus sp.]|nr:hypothetical protein [Anaerotruncus sp.]
MRMLLLVYDVDFDDEVMEMLGRLPWQATPNGTECWARERDQNPSSMIPCGRDSINAVAIVADDETEESVFASLRALFEKLGGKGFAVFELPVLRVI